MSTKINPTVSEPQSRFVGKSVPAIFLILLLCCLSIRGQSQSPTPDSSQFVDNATSLFKQGKLDDAQQAAQQAIKADPASYIAYAVAAKIAAKQGNAAQTKEFVDKALELAPDTEKDKIRQLAAMLVQQNSSPTPQTPTTELSDDDRHLVSVLKVLLEKAENATTVEDRSQACEDILTRSIDFVKAHPEQTNVWVMRGVAAVVLNRAHEGWEAGQHLKALGMMHSDDPTATHLLAELDVQGWLGQEPKGPESNAVPMGPRMTIIEPEYNFGRAMAGELIEHEFVVKNAGDQTLEIYKVSPGCRCTTVGNWAHKIEPGKTGEIPVQFDSGNFRGNLTKTITVTSNDKLAPNQTIKLQGTIWRALEVTPQTAFINVKPDASSNATSVVHISNQSDQPVTLSDPTSANGSFKAELKTITPGKEFEVIITAVQPLAPGNTTGKISVKTSLINMPVVNITTIAMMRN